jgi:hypothetical protein
MKPLLGKEYGKAGVIFGDSEKRGEIRKKK